MVHLDAAVHVGIPHWLISRMVEYDVFIALVAHLEEASEEGRHAPELILAPCLVRMVVALGAIEPAAEKHAHLFRHGFARRTDHVVGKEVAAGSVVALRDEPLARHAVIWLVRGDALSDPLAVHLAPFRLDAI